ncbi:MAG: cytochrome b/b6 domain-containing protein, partial [Deltaproteobacteria bacterium]|nr:cytochrome b/b6 domain-containing protein [Deltaproteobacteria bacterium]
IEQANCLVDKWGLIIYLFILIALFFHFLGNIVSGRFRERFILGNHKKITEEEYILPPIRLIHWINFISILSLIITGFLIRYKLSKSYMQVWKRHHYCFIVLVLVNLIIRLIYAFVGKTKTYKDYLIGKKDILNTPQVIKYYLFLKDSYDHVAKYASLQKLAYTLFWWFLVVQGVTGTAILKPEVFLRWMDMPIDKSILLMRVIHVGVTWSYIVFISVHIYLSIMEGYTLFKFIMLNIEPEVVDG